GIGAQMRDFGCEMMVCRVEHELPHQHVAMEWFRYGQTLALLPLNGDRASIVLTLPGHEMQALQALDDAALGQEFERRFDGRMGKMQVIGSRHVYPLVGVYAERFAGRRCALVGDAAVGMHPVTAHGFNLGLLGQQRLAREVLAAHRAGRGPACPAALRRYERGHRMTARPLYLATTLVAGMYGDERPPARLARDAALRLAQHVTPFRRLIAAHLTRG
ncbi:MAG: FAD-dependent monooxygenase, partial [Lysobacteraceae bacterium]